MVNMLENGIVANAAQYPEVFYNALQTSNTIEKDYFGIIPGVKADSINVNKLDINGGLVKEDTRDCSWDPSVIGSLGQKNIALGNLKVNAEQCIDSLDSLFSQEAYKATKRGEMAPEFETLLLNRIGKAVGLDIERLIWVADKSMGDPVDGVFAKARQDGTTIKVQGTTLNASNILTEVEKVFASIPQAVLDEAVALGADGEAGIFMGPVAYRYLIQALSTTPTNVNVTLPSWTVNDGQVAYLGIKINMAQGIPADKMFAASKANMKIVTNLLSDAELTAEKGTSPKEKNILFITAQFKLGADYINGNEVVIYE